MLIQSALAGQGIALAWSGLLSNHLQTGNLLRPTQAILRTNAQFCLLEPQGRAPNRQTVSRFRPCMMAPPACTGGAPRRDGVCQSVWTSMGADPLNQNTY